MCGIFGAIDTKSCFGTAEFKTFSELTDLVGYRGPDSCGVCTLAAHGQNASRERFDVFLGHRRLSILDLSDDGRQPMTDGEGTWITYNGEIFNYLELREKLEAEGCRFRTATDTEVILKTYKRYGTAGFDQFNGMWAFAIVDLKQRKLILSRDRFSMKPLFVHRDGSRLYWASEIKQLLPLMSKKDLNQGVMSAFLAQALVEHSSETFVHGIERLPAKSFWVVSLDDSSVQQGLYWDYSTSEDVSGDPIQQFRDLFLDSVRLRLRSDVKVGCLLSGGLDSSSITAACKPALGHRLETYSVISEDPRFNEEVHIDRMVAHLQCSNRKLMFRPETALQGLDRVLHHNDEPVAGFSVVAQFEMLKMIRKETDVVVLLSGQGADEILLGYLKFFFLNVQHLLANGRLLSAMSQLVMSAIRGTAVRQFRLSEGRRYIPRLTRKGLNRAVLNSSAPIPIWTMNDMRDRQIADIDKYSVPALARYEDRNAMAHSLEVRHPFLDHRLVNFVINLPSSLKLNRGWTKYILRKSMNELLPNSIRWRRDKLGFSIPEEHWLRYELKSTILKSLEKSILAEHGILDRGVFLRHYDAFLRRKSVSYGDISRVYIAEVWARRFLKAEDACEILTTAV